MCHLFLPPLFPPFPMTQFTWYPPLSPLSVKKFPCPTPLYPFPMKYPLWSLPNWMHLNSLDSLDSLAFAFVLSYIEPEHRCIDYFSSTLLAIFLEQLVLNNYLAEEGAFTQIGTEFDLARPRIRKIIIYHIQLYSELFRSTFRTKLRNVIVFDHGTSFVCAWRVPKSNQIQNKTIT